MENGKVEVQAPQTHRPTELSLVVDIIGKALADRLLVWVALLGGVVGFGYAVYSPDELRLMTVCLYAGLVLLPLVWRTVGKK